MKSGMNREKNGECFFFAKQARRTVVHHHVLCVQLRHSGDARELEVFKAFTSLGIARMLWQISV
jgi:hypothetical protein